MISTNVPNYPALDGLEQFGGKLMHSARWDWTYGLKAKRVAVIGVGSTAAQIVPEVAKEAHSVTVYQRTPNWIVPRMDSFIPSWKRSLFKWLPYFRRQKRSQMMTYREGSYQAVVKPAPGMGQQFEALCMSHMRTQLPERQDLWTKFTPNYTPGCKRVIMSDDFYPAFLRDNVRLESRKITKITTEGIEVEGAAIREYDLIILATGFRTVDFMYPIAVTGAEGRSLADIWQNGPEALNGIAVESLPNFSIMYGPNTNLSHNSIILMIEAQSRYISALIKEVTDGATAGRQVVIQPRSQKVKDYNVDLQSDLSKTNYADPNCNSWYKLSETGRVVNNWPRTAVEYQEVGEIHA
jgi:cation diffusion facilitator CzcD-associated flavoprotein CzcO